MPLPPIHKIPAFTTTAGAQPEHDASIGSAKELRSWQARGFTALRDHRRRILISPTGSGKSTLMKALTFADLDNDPSSKVIIALPQLLIAGSFEPVDLALVIAGFPVAHLSPNYATNTGSSSRHGPHS